MAEKKEKHKEEKKTEVKDYKDEKKFKKEENLEIKISKEARAVIGITIVTIIAIVAIFYFSKTAGKFEYNGVPFQKEYTGSILFYIAKVPVVDIHGRQIGVHSIDFRNSPFDLEDIPVKIDGTIKFVNDKIVYITYSDLPQCDYNGVAAINLGRFLGNVGLNIKGAVMNGSQNDSKTLYVTCSLYPENTVIEVKNGEETKIVRSRENCYEIISNGCDILKAVEKFQLVVLEQYIDEINNLLKYSKI